MERKGLIGKENKKVVDSDNLLYTALSNSYLQGDNQMKNYTRQAKIRHYKNKLKSVKDNIREVAIRLKVVETPEVHIASVMENRQLPAQVTH